jgi:hypothetical protein
LEVIEIRPAVSHADAHHLLLDHLARRHDCLSGLLQGGFAGAWDHHAGHHQDENANPGWYRSHRRGLDLHDHGEDDFLPPVGRIREIR